jgi:hypothetical protein
MERLHTTSTAARAADTPEAYVRNLIAKRVIEPLRDESGRSLLTDEHVRQIIAYRAKTLRRDPLRQAG